MAIVGAGYAALWTAGYLLKARPSRVVLLEAKSVGFSAALYSPQAALDLQETMNATVVELSQRQAAEDIEADFAQQGFFGKSTPVICHPAAWLERAQGHYRTDAQAIRDLLSLIDKMPAPCAACLGT